MPLPHNTQVPSLLGLAYFPLTHEIHTALEVAPTTFENVPMAQAVHSDIPEEPLNVPAMQGLHELEFDEPISPLNLPCPHNEHIVLPESASYLPVLYQLIYC